MRAARNAARRGGRPVADPPPPPRTDIGRGAGCWEDSGYQMTGFQGMCDALMRMPPAGRVGRWNSSRKAPRRPRAV